jgi:hypothetical protein
VGVGVFGDPDLHATRLFLAFLLRLGQRRRRRTTDGASSGTTNPTLENSWLELRGGE